MRPRPGHRSAHLGAVGAYLLLAIALWWGVWSGHPTSTATCGCGDTSIMTWFMEWPAYALTHGDQLLFSTRVLHPAGVNLPANTSFLAVSVVLTPVTWLFGPVASLNVAATLAPVGGALAARGLLLRWGTWAPAAFCAGLFYGFSPFVIENLALEHVDFATLAVPPLLLLCLDELLVRQRGRAWPWGLTLGGLCAVQFFVSSEILVMAALAAAIGIVLLVVATAVHSPAAVASRGRHAVAGLAVAGATGGALLAGPITYALAGPQHLPSKVWPDVQYFGSSWHTLLFPAGAHDRGPNPVLESYGYFGSHPLLLGYLGLGLAAVIAVGLAWFHRDRRLWFFAVLLVAVEGCSLGASEWPWRLLDHLPLTGDLVPDRFAGVADLCAAVLLGLTIDRVRRSGLRWPGRSPGRWPEAALLAAVALAAVALVPIAATERLPFTTRPVDVPRWFTSAATSLPTDAVVLTYPYASSGLRAPMTWQAVDGLRYSLVGGGAVTPDPPRHPSPSERAESAAESDLDNLSDGFAPLPTGSRAESSDLRVALRDWGVTVVVIPSEQAWPLALRGRSVPVAVATMTAALGGAPVFSDDAWVWSVPPRLAPPLRVAPATFAACTTSAVAARDPGRAATCVLASATGR